MEKTKIKLILSSFLFLFLLLIPTMTMASEFIPCGIDSNNNGKLDPSEKCGFCDIFVLINNIINFILTRLTPAIAILMLVGGGAMYATSGVNPNNLTMAKEILKATVVGLLIVLTSWIFLNTFLSFMGVSEWTGIGTWWQIQCL